MGRVWHILFDTSDFPARWNCGQWTSLHGWVHIVSDIATWGAYTAIPTVLLIYWMKRRREMPFDWLYLLFALFILACGSVHLIEAIIFWQPIYRFSALLKATTAIVSWMTVLAIIRVAPAALRLPGLAATNTRLQHEMVQRQRLEESLRASEEKATRANQAKSTFLANMSHEIRTPMTAILGHAELLVSDANSREASQSIATIKRNGEYLLMIVNDILDIARIEADRVEISRQPSDLPHILLDVVSLMQVRAEEAGLDLRVVGQGRVPRHIDTDPIRLKQILINLVGNAIKFTQQGCVEIRVEGVEATSAQESEPTAVRFAVRDTGAGISAEEQGNLFLPFYQIANAATRDSGGSGLGLTISHRLVRLLGGDLAVISEQGRGTTFHFTLSVGSCKESTFCEFPLVTPEVLVSSGGAPPKLVGRLLVVDDNRDIRYLARHFLEQAGATVETTDDGMKAIQMVRLANDQNESFDAIIMDIQMPEMDGFTAVRELRTGGIATPIIALTASAMLGDREQCLSVGCDDYVTKPIDAKQLIAAVSRQLTKSVPSSGA